MNSHILNAHNISLNFGTKKVVKNASLTLETGSFVGIIGPNGAGKTSLLRVMAGLLNPQNGKVELYGQNLSSMPRTEIACNVGYVPQGVEISFPFTVYEVIKMGRYARTKGFFDLDEKAGNVIQSAIDWMDLNALSDRLFTQLSGGEKQRVLIASALAQEPHLLLLDEPTSALDLKHQQSIYRRLKELSINEGKTIVIVTHDINLAAQFCSRIILLNEGQITKDGTPDDVLIFPIIEEVYGVKVYIDVNPFTDSIYILPFDTK